MDSQTESLLRIKASFRVMGAGLEPETVSTMLGLSPDYSHRRGDPRIRSGGQRYSDYAEGIWVLRSKTESEHLEDHITELVNQVIHSKDALLRLIDTGLRADLFIGVMGLSGQYGYVLQQDLLRQLVDLRVVIGFDIYTSSDEAGRVG